MFQNEPKPSSPNDPKTPSPDPEVTKELELIFLEPEFLYSMGDENLSSYIETCIHEDLNETQAYEFARHLLLAAKSQPAVPEGEIGFTEKLSKIALKMLTSERDEIKKLGSNTELDGVTTTVVFAFNILSTTLPDEAESGNDSTRHRTMPVVLEMLELLHKDTISFDIDFDPYIASKLFDIAACIEEVDDDLPYNRHCGTFEETQELALRWLSRSVPTFLNDDSSYVVESCAELLATHPDDEVVEELKRAVDAIATSFLVKDMDLEVMVSYATQYSRIARCLAEIHPDTVEQRQFWLKLWRQQSVVSSEALYCLSTIDPNHAAYLFMNEAEGTEGSFLNADDIPLLLSHLLNNKKMSEPLAKVLAALGEDKARSLIEQVSSITTDVEDRNQTLRPFAASVLMKLHQRG